MLGEELDFVGDGWGLGLELGGVMLVVLGGRVFLVLYFFCRGFFG